MLFLELALARSFCMELALARSNIIRNEKKLRSLNIKASALTQWLLVITQLGIIFLV